jgi:hypothetical protein
MIRKPFEQSEYDQCNDLAIQKVSEYLKRTGHSVYSKEDYKIDLTVIDKDENVSYHEVEIKKVWTGKFKYKTLQVPERKGRYAKKGHFIWVLNKDTTQAYVFFALLLTDDILEEVPNKKTGNIGERFYQVPIEMCKLIKF